MAKPKVSEARAKLIWGRIWEASSSYYEGKATQRLIAADSGLSYQLVTKWKKGLSMPSPETLERLADKYSVSLAWLSGQDVEQQQGDYERFSDISNRAFSIAKEMVEVLLPNGTQDEYFQVIERAMELVLEGRDTAEVRGILFEEVRQMKREG
ncbi:transcriptional regulator [Vreelandella populi]|uniref:transcriptional regulator n=1 Tax=Vreelandella populi TaxID=2498858 RepID=UPI000F8D20C9|nr:transcriptional regulator [Halomonas populi]RUR52729.1 transcriptional regulator [Halomonas populi]